MGAQPLIAIALLVIGAVDYPLAWESNAYLFGFLVIGLAPVQTITAVVGIIGRTIGRGSRSRISGVAWALDVALLASAALVVVLLRSINWA